ncbi:hypothetical protein [Roseateles puraquae]|jgi:hypothetical protein|uniref:Uncharacterized protein n=1 Tax=Roseateles puraquae TaxID=431059 RepID=A0A254N8S7_9BURK|nr:hypothetical protein [Roseateles puraquae]MCF8205477.1 hypothetical protein [Methylotenera sp.]MDG0856574.1 hypothetical protein [Roseateles puraquae]OWR03964.1 hypothetical protein CDO81_12260 [Roseateles puraquae]
MVRIPAALKWLITHRGRLLGEIKKVKKRQAAREAQIEAAISAIDKRRQTLEKRLSIIRSRTPLLIQGIESDMAAIDRAISQHRIMVDADSISAIKSQERAYYLQPGQMTRLILKALREANGEELTTNEIAVFVMTESKLQIPGGEFYEFKLAVRKRMRAMHAAGLLRRAAVGGHTVESRWTQAPLER